MPASCFEPHRPERFMHSILSIHLHLPRLFSPVKYFLRSSGQNFFFIKQMIGIRYMHSKLFICYRHNLTAQCEEMMIQMF